VRVEAGGHRGSYDPDAAEQVDIGLFALLPGWPTTCRCRSSPRAGSQPTPVSSNDLDLANHWPGQHAALATAEPAGDIVTRMWRDALRLLL